MIVMDVCSLPRRPWATRDLVKLSDPDVCLCDHIGVSKETFCEITGEKIALQELQRVLLVRLSSR